MKKNFLLREVAGEYLLVPLIDGETQFNSIITMNETGAFIWKKLVDNLNSEQIAEEMTKEYNVTYQQAVIDVQEYINYLKEKDII